MVNIVKTKTNEKIRTSDIVLGITLSKDYYCLKCENRMAYVKEHKNNGRVIFPHFRHLNDKNKEIDDCEYYSKQNYSSEDKKNDIKNKKSGYHMFWQNLFEVSNLEYKILENKKLHYADIYLEKDEIKINDEQGNSIFKINPKKLVIEIQHSKITLEVLKERTNFYKNSDEKRELIWIFDLENKCKIYKIKLFNEVKYRIKLLDPHTHSFTQIYNTNEIKESIIILDNGNDDIYLVKEQPTLDKDYLEVNKISKNHFLEEINKNIELNKDYLKKMNDLKKEKYILFDYETPINELNIRDDKKNILRHIFYVMENIQYYILKDTLLEMLYAYLMYYSNNNKKVWELFKNYVLENIPMYNDEIDFGIYKGMQLNEILINEKSYNDLKDWYYTYNWNDKNNKSQKTLNKILELKNNIDIMLKTNHFYYKNKDVQNIINDCGTDYYKKIKYILTDYKILYNKNLLIDLLKYKDNDTIIYKQNIYEMNKLVKLYKNYENCELKKIEKVMNNLKECYNKKYSLLIKQFESYIFVYNYIVKKVKYKSERDTNRINKNIKYKLSIINILKYLKINNIDNLNNYIKKIKCNNELIYKYDVLIERYENIVEKTNKKINDKIIENKIIEKEIRFEKIKLIINNGDEELFKKKIRINIELIMKNILIKNKYCEINKKIDILRKNKLIYYKEVEREFNLKLILNEYKIKNNINKDEIKTINKKNTKKKTKRLF